MELIIIVTIIAVVAVAAMALLNPKRQIEKSWDGQRKSDLSTLKKYLEDWYNDKNCYPAPSDICYGAAPGNPCPICGQENTPANFAHYLDHLPCDPNHSTQNYLYQVENTDCPSWYRIYTRLSIVTDPIIEEAQCQDNSCGPSAPYEGQIYGYSWGVSSPNIDLERAP